MGTPLSNPEGYKEGDVCTHVKNVEGALLLVHGLVDENVHFRTHGAHRPGHGRRGQGLRLIVLPERAALAAVGEGPGLPGGARVLRLHGWPITACPAACISVSPPRRGGVLERRHGLTERRASRRFRLFHQSPL